MRFAICTCVAVLAFSGSICPAQISYPSVAEIMKQYDADKDGMLTQREIAKSRYLRQFPRWDKDQNGKVSDEDIIVFRRRFGIAADGTLLGGRQPMLSIPDIASLPRVDRNHRPTRQATRDKAYLLRTTPHVVDGDEYIILTDHTAAGFLEPLKRLAKHHNGRMIEVSDLASLYKQPDAFKRVREQLRNGKARFVAIAPRMESFRENMLLTMWKMLSTIDTDPQIDVFPGLLLASNADAFGKLIDQSIDFRPVAVKKMRPLAISQVQRASEMRSLQKAAMYRKEFATLGVKTPVVAIYGHQAADATKLTGDHVWNLNMPGRRKFVKRFPAPVLQALDDARLIIMHGHGVPGMSCSVDIEGLPDDLSGKILLSGSCFSAAPLQSDLPQMRQAPGGYEVNQRDAFVIRAVDSGVVVAFGHQRLSFGFPHLYPVLETWMKGETVGRAYQQLLNGLIELQSIRADEFVIPTEQNQRNRHPQNSLLYVVIGDPALQPLESLKQ